MASLTYDEQEQLTEELNWSMSARTVARFCEEHGYDLSDKDVLDSVLHSVYQCGYRWAERDADPCW